MGLDRGIFTVPLDFELYWGVRDKRTIEGYGENLRGVQRAIPEILRVFRGSDIHATWATVGFLFFEDCADLKRNLPQMRPAYRRPGLSPYTYIDKSSELEAVYHLAPELIRQIARQRSRAKRMRWLPLQTSAYPSTGKSGRTLEFATSAHW
jgi:hypothetical protein